MAEAEKKKDRLLKAFTEGGSEFAEIRDMLSKVTDDAARLHRELASMDAMPTVLALHPHIEATYRRQIEELEAALAMPEAQLEAIPRLRALISRIVLHPRLDKQRGVTVEVVRQMDEILAIATDPAALQA